eukprot:m.129957 g.129957  ORF g.129957 m.129957 type:complete len:439 (-) comp17462_c0_seq31:488-1804(-)
MEATRPPLGTRWSRHHRCPHAGRTSASTPRSLPTLPKASASACTTSQKSCYDCHRKRRCCKKQNDGSTQRPNCWATSPARRCGCGSTNVGRRCSGLQSFSSPTIPAHTSRKALTMPTSLSAAASRTNWSRDRSRAQSMTTSPPCIPKGTIPTPTREPVADGTVQQTLYPHRHGADTSPTVCLTCPHTLGTHGPHNRRGMCAMTRQVPRPTPPRVLPSEMAGCTRLDLQPSRGADRLTRVCTLCDGAYGSVSRFPKKVPLPGSMTRTHASVWCVRKASSRFSIDDIIAVIAVVSLVPAARGTDRGTKTTRDPCARVLPAWPRVSPARLSSWRTMKTCPSLTTRSLCGYGRRRQTHRTNPSMLQARSPVCHWNQVLGSKKGDFAGFAFGKSLKKAFPGVPNGTAMVNSLDPPSLFASMRECGEPVEQDVAANCRHAKDFT